MRVSFPRPALSAPACCSSSEEERLKLLRRFALAPSLFSTLWADWKAAPPSDTVARSHLKLGLKLNEQSARSALNIYRENLLFAYLPDQAKIPEHRSGGQPELPAVRVGDYIQWTSAGVGQFHPPRQVTWISDDGSHLRVHASNTGIPMSEVTLAAPPAVKLPESLKVDPLPENKAAQQRSKNPVSVLLEGNRLQISANVDAEGLKQLKEVLAKYEEILNMLQ